MGTVVGRAKGGCSGRAGVFRTAFLEVCGQAVEARHVRRESARAAATSPDPLKPNCWPAMAKRKATLRSRTVTGPLILTSCRHSAHTKAPFQKGLRRVLPCFATHCSFSQACPHPPYSIKRGLHTSPHLIFRPPTLAKDEVCATFILLP